MSFGPGVAGLEGGVGNVAERLRQPHMALLHTLLSEATRPESPIAEAYRRYHQQDRDEIADWLATTAARPDVDLEDDQLAVLLYAMFIGIHVQWRVAPEQIELEPTLAAMMSFVMSGWNRTIPLDS